MISEQHTLTFVWRCSGCAAVYDCETVALLLDDGTSKACSCGGRLLEDVGPAPERSSVAVGVPRRSPVGPLRSV